VIGSTVARAQIIRLFGGAGADVLVGGDGDDTLVPDRGDDIVRGGKGRDTIRYTGLPSLDIDLGAGTAGRAIEGGAGAEDRVEADLIYNIENVRASRGHDRIVGSEKRNILYGYLGRDQLLASAGTITSSRATDRTLLMAATGRIGWTTTVPCAIGAGRDQC